MIKVLDGHWNFKTRKVTLYCKTQDGTKFEVIFPAKSQEQMDTWLKKNFGQKIKQNIELGIDKRLKISKIPKRR